MRLSAKSSAFGLLIVGWLTSTSCAADPLHPFQNDGTWRHEFSGWQFPKQVSGLIRVQAPYTIDGNNDVGAQYEQTTNDARVAAIVEIYMADSVATDAKLDGAKATAARKAGVLVQARSEKPFKVDSNAPVRGMKVAYGKHTSLYFFATDRWSVKVLGSTEGNANDKQLDAFVRALPWNTLGDPTALH